MSYPVSPNAVTKKKYYDFITNLPLFIPVGSMATEFSKLLEEYPVAPYLDSRDSLIRWMHFIHNKINERLEKPKISLEEFFVRYYEFYKPPIIQNETWKAWQEKIKYAVLVSILVFIIFYFYPK
jgi:hypothetical protein